MGAGMGLPRSGRVTSTAAVNGEHSPLQNQFRARPRSLLGPLLTRAFMRADNEEDAAEVPVLIEC